jgi:hypothetical protein
LTCLRCGLSASYGSTTIVVMTIHHDHILICSLFIHSRKGYKLPLLKGRFYGQETKKAARVDCRRAPRSENDGAQENASGQNCQEVAPV